jgi:putative transcription factor
MWLAFMILMGTCEMCGAEAKLQEVIVEGSMLKVCKRCSGFGTAVEVKKKVAGIRIGGKRVPRKIYMEEPVNFVVEGAGRMIKESREKRELTQGQLAGMVGIKESIVHKIETSMQKPDLSTAKKIERILDIKLIEGYKDSENKVQFNLDDKDLTIGDLLKFKKR